MLALAVALIALAAPPTPPDSFSTLTHVKAGGWADVWYDPAHTTVHNTPFEAYEEGAVLVLETQLQASEKARYKLVFSPGPSDDPHFVVVAPTGAEISTISGEALYLPGNGNLYVSGSANQMYDKRRKYHLHDGAISEVPQPMYYVGMDTTVTQTEGGPAVLTLYTQQSEADPVATLPIGAPIHVLVNVGEWYLVRTSFGLTGWTRVPEGTYASMIGLTFMGD